MDFNTIDVFDLKPGAKIDMRYLQLVAKNGRSDDDSHFVSGIFDIEEDGTLEIEMPMRGGKAVLVPMGVRYEFIFTMDRRLYKANAEIVGRFKKGGFSLLKAKLVTKVEKFQRREYFRLDLMLPLDYITLSDDAGELKKMGDIRQLIEGHQGELVFGTGTILNLSGGGLKFNTDLDLSNVHYLFMRFALELGGKSHIIALIGEILKSDDGEKKKENQKYRSYRVKLHYKDTGNQDQIIRFIFEQERKIRKKELG